jgi:hypothetical protein
MVVHQNPLRRGASISGQIGMLSNGKSFKTSTVGTTHLPQWSSKHSITLSHLPIQSPDAKGPTQVLCPHAAACQCGPAKMDSATTRRTPRTVAVLVRKIRIILAKHCSDIPTQKQCCVLRISQRHTTAAGTSFDNKDTSENCGANQTILMRGWHTQRQPNNVDMLRENKPTQKKRDWCYFSTC